MQHLREWLRRLDMFLKGFVLVIFILMVHGVTTSVM
jgi:hypothetical protein